MVISCADNNDLWSPNERVRDDMYLKQQPQIMFSSCSRYASVCMRNGFVILCLIEMPLRVLIGSRI